MGGMFFSGLFVASFFFGGGGGVSGWERLSKNG